MLTDAQLCRLCEYSYQANAYEPNADIITAPGLKAIVYGGRSGDPNSPAVIVFRGTADLPGWAIDATAPLVKPRECAGLVHLGFREAWEILKPRVRLAVGFRPVVITGHSLGGALATLAAAHFGPRCLRVVTFGSPRVGDAAFVAEYKRLVECPTVRYVNAIDPIPWVPGWLMGYRHVCPATWFDRSQWREFGPLQWALSLLDWWKSSKERLWADHAIGRYCEAMTEGERQVLPFAA